MSVPLLILGLVLLITLIVVHELGHYLVAVKNGVEAEEFGIGFPPRIWGKKLKNGTLLSFNWLPLGGFVKLKGEHDSDRQPGSYGAANLWTKTKIMTAGVAMNLVTALVLLTVLAIVGMPKVIDNQFTVTKDTKTIKNEVMIGYVEPASPAEKSGLKVGDQLLAFHAHNEINCLSLNCPRPETINITNQQKLPDITKQLAGQEIQINYIRNGHSMITQANLLTASVVQKSQNTNNPKGYLGISPIEYTITRSTWSAPIVALGLAKQIIWLTFQGLGHIVSSLASGHTSQATQQVAGPVGIFVLIKDGSTLGYQFILFIIAVISLTLAIMNILPIPALDGGRLFVTWFYRLIRRPLTKRTEERIHGTGFALLMLLFVLITIVDIKRYF
jgi:regulator of sigma E protease